jgi:hypothetical protein
MKTEERKVSWLISDNTVTVNFDGKTHMLPRTDAYAKLLIKALKEKNFDQVPDLVSAAKRIEKFSHGHFQVRDNQILIDGQVAPAILGKKIKEFADQGLPYEPLVKFAQKLRNNPSKRALDHLYEFLEQNNFTITESGSFIGYKKIRDDWTDKATGTFDNSVGNSISMPRNEVDEDPDHTCSYGLHVSNWEYQANFGAGRTIEVEVNPADVVAIPRDYNGSKIRVCAYRVLSEIEVERTEVLREDDSDEVCLDCSCRACGNDNCGFGFNCGNEEV